MDAVVVGFLAEMPAEDSLLGPPEKKLLVERLTEELLLMPMEKGTCFRDDSLAFSISWAARSIENLDKYL